MGNTASCALPMSPTSPDPSHLFTIHMLSNSSSFPTSLLEKAQPRQAGVFLLPPKPFHQPRAGSLITQGGKIPPVMLLATTTPGHSLSPSRLSVPERAGGSSGRCSKDQWPRIVVVLFFFPYEEKISFPYQTRITIYRKLCSEFRIWNERKWYSIVIHPN